ncbi:MAG: glycosyltransferase family A protein [Gallionella sp.]|jgi:glycosyltransferase involved in cell wall biosynthesis
MIKYNISVVMPLYNKELEVARAIRSVLAQSHTDFELIIVNDGSNDGSVEQVTIFSDERIRLVNQDNQGVSVARNRGVDESNSDLVAFIDSDDEWLPDFLKTILTLVENYPDADVFATSYFMRDSLGKSRTPILRGLDKGFSEGILSHYFQLAARSDPPIWSSAVAVKKSALFSVGGFPSGIRNGEDLLTWARLAVNYSIAYSTEPLSVFWMPADVTRRIGRFDDEGDPVGVKLEELFGTITGSQRMEFRSYLANWHRMRAVTFLRTGNRSACLNSIFSVVRLGGFNLQMLCVMVLVFLPNSVFILNLLKSALEFKRTQF